MEEHKQKLISSGSGIIILVSILYILIGIAMLGIDKCNPSIILIIAGAVIAVIGLISIAKYYIAADYEETGEYGFSIGVFLIIIGLLIIFKSKTLEPWFYMFLGICMLLTSVLKLQHALDLKGIGSGMWSTFLIVAIIFIAAAFVVVLDPKSYISQHVQIVYIVLIADGIINIFSIIYKNFAVQSLKHRIIEHAKDIAKHEKDADND